MWTEYIACIYTLYKWLFDYLDPRHLRSTFFLTFSPFKKLKRSTLILTQSVYSQNCSFVGF